jgi:peptidoglycan/LPS O-acetylase OafA/YrhL
MSKRSRRRAAAVAEAEAVSHLARGARLPALDGVRGIAISLVMLYHFFAVSGPPGARLDSIVTRITGVGWSGVDVFFVLSGFLITGILLDARSGNSPYFRTFYGRRILRIFPLYYGALALLLFLLPAVQNLDASRVTAFRDHQLWYWSYTLNLRPAFGGSPTADIVETWHLWSLAIEEQYYIVWPTIVLLLGRRRLLGACLGMIAFSVALRIAMRLAGADEQFIYKFTPARMDGLAAGSALAIIARSPRDLARFARLMPYAGMIAVAVLAVVAARNGGLEPYDADVLSFGLLAVTVIGAAILIAALRAPDRSPASLFFNAAPLRWLGRYSYGMYVIHWPVAVALARDTSIVDAPPVISGSTMLGRLLVFAVALAITSSIAWLSWHLYESQFLKLKERLPYRSSPPVMPAAAEPVAPPVG